VVPALENLTMTIEFDDFVTVVHKFRNEVVDARLFSIAERRAIQLLLDGINRANENILRRFERQN
jgi:hypothetical protein